MEFDYSEPGYVKTLDREIIDRVYEYYKTNAVDKESLHSTLSHNVLQSNYDEWNNDLADEMEYLKNNTFPFGEEINYHWVKSYDESQGVNGGFAGLHHDHYPWNVPEGKLLVVNSILLYRSDDLDGGDLVFAGDEFVNDDGTSEEKLNRRYDTRHVRHRLEICKHNTPGDLLWWNEYTVHGVARVKKGKKVTLLISKFVDIDDKYFIKAKEGVDNV